MKAAVIGTGSISHHHIEGYVNNPATELYALCDINLERAEAIAQEIRAAGGRIDAVYVCTETDDAHPMRKPQTGMFHEACRDFPDIAPERSVMLGDAESDRAFAANCGMPFVLVETAEITLRSL